MRRLVIALLALVGLLVVLDVAARLWVERRIEDRAEARLHAVGSVDASVASFPFLGRLVVAGEVSHVTLRLHDVAEAGIPIAQLELDVDGTVFDRGSLLSGDRVEVESIDEVEIRAIVTDRALSELTNADVSIDEDEVRVTAAGRTVVARTRVVEGEVVFQVDPLPALRVPVPDADVLPCEPRVELEARQLVLACTAEELPPRLVQAIGEVVAGEP